MSVQKKNICILLILFLANLSFAQKSSINAAFISVYGGDLSILSENVLDFYDSKNDFTFGVGIGIPLGSSLTADASVSYLNKESNLIANNSSIEVGNANLKQIIFNAGFQIHLLPNRIVGLSFLLGANYALIEEERRDSNGEVTYQVDDAGNIGVYGGANLELSFGKGPLALFGDVKYTYSWNPLLEFDDSYRELRFTGGLKFYLSDRW